MDSRQKHAGMMVIAIAAIWHLIY